MTLTDERPATDRRTGDADQADEIAWKSEGLLGRLWSDSRATEKRLRRQLLPHVATGAVIGTGFAAEAVAAAGMVTPGQAALVTASAALSATGIAAAVARGRARKWLPRLIVGGLAAAVWLAVAPWGVGPREAAALLAVEYAIAARWWQSIRPRHPLGRDVKELTAPEDTVTQIMRDWNEFVASSGGPLPGSQLLMPKKTEHGYEFVLLFARGKQTLGTALSALDKIAGGLDLDVDEIIVEKHPTMRSTARARFQIITDSPIEGDIVFDKPRRVGDPGFGLLQLGPYADGSGEACYRLYTPGSMWSGVIIGGTGIGKSRVVENLIISALSGGDTDFWYLDPAMGGSSPALANHADWFTTMDQLNECLDSALEMLDARAEENALEGWTGFTPSPERPGLVIVVEECHNPFAHRPGDWARIAREGRKVGISILCISQYSGIITFGGDEALRSSIMEGNVIAMRSTSNQNGPMMPGLEVDPKTLPKIPGYGYIQGSAETGTRTAPFRNRDTNPDDDPQLAARWLSRLPQPGLDLLSATATQRAGRAYADRNAAADTGRSASAARIAELRGGRLPARPEPEAAGSGSGGDTAGGGAGVIAFPGPLGSGPAAPTQVAFPQPAPVASPPSSVGLPPMPGNITPSQRAVLTAIAEGLSRPVSIQSATGLKHRRVAQLLSELLDAGLIWKPRTGRYKIRNSA